MPDMAWIRDLLTRRRDAPADPARILQSEIAGLEARLAAAEQQVAEIQTAAAVAEQSAIDAVRAGDDRLARSALMKQRDYVEEAERIEADVAVLRALLDESRDFLATLPSSPLPPE